MIWFSTVVFLAVLLGSTQAVAADRPPPLIDYSRRLVFEAVEWTPGDDPPSSRQRDLWPQGLAMVGREDIARRLFPPSQSARICDAVPGRGAFDPVGVIVKRARASRIVILNEAHHKAWHRAFFEDVAVALGREGFTILAAESFNPNVNQDRTPYPRNSDGFYVSEPAYGEALRQALRLGYRLVPYEFIQNISDEEFKRRAQRPVRESSLADIAEREQAQAENLMARIFAADKMSKVLVYVGYSHAEESPSGPIGMPEMNSEWMASRLKRLSGIDPLTIDVTEFRTPADRAIVCDVNGSAQRRMKTDMAIALPTPRIVRNRLDWRLKRGYKFVDVPSMVLDEGKWNIVEARYVNEPDDAVSADRVLLGPGEDVPLLLKRGAYRVEGWTREGGWGRARPLIVP